MFTSLIKTIWLGMFFCLMPANGLLANNISHKSEDDENYLKLRWLGVHVPPINIMDGPHKGQGLLGGVLEVLARETGMHEYKITKINASRLFQMVKQADYCVPGIVKTPEREEILHFSDQPTAVIEASHLVYSVGNKAIVAMMRETSSLETLLQNGFRVGVGKGLSYGVKSDEILKSPANAENVHVHHSPDVLSPLLSMLERGRLDFILAPPWTIEWHLKRNSKKFIMDGRKFVTVPYPESDGEILYFAACSKSNVGKSNIRLINKALSRHKVQEALEMVSKRWMKANDW